MKAKTSKILSIACTAVSVAVVIALNIAAEMFSGFIDAFLSTPELDSASRAAGQTLATQIEEEGIVMVKNDNDCLPLDKEEVTKVNVFGWASTQWLMGGSGSGRSVTSSDGKSPTVDFLKALQNYGIEYNTELTNAYKSFQGSRPFWSDTLNTHDYESCRLYEPKYETFYTAARKQQAEEYSDTAIVVLARNSGESNDCPLVQYKNYTNSGKVPETNIDRTRTYLDISTEEEAMLNYVAGAFENVIVVVNSTNAMNLNFMDSIEGLDACLIVGGTGDKAAIAIPEVMYGETMPDAETGETKPLSPSGKTVDTQVYDFKTNPGFAYTGMEGVTQYAGNNTGMYPLTTTNPNVGSSDNRYPGVNYLDYVEGIYVGYKWYETADTMGYWNNVNNEYGRGYEGVVQYPFGFGLTYTNFSWMIVDATPAAGSNLTANGTISLTVRVTNEGNFPAQEVVEAYFTAPWTNGGIEKSSVVLAAFAKTPTAVAPGESQDLTLTFKVKDMASYDYACMKTSEGGYVLEKGLYTISLRTDSHTLATMGAGSATVNYNVAADQFYDGASNKVTSASSLDYGISVDSSTEFGAGEDIQWLSRNDFASTFSSEKAEARVMSARLKQYNLYNQAMITEWENKQEAVDTPTMGAKNDIKIQENGEINLEYGDPENFYNDDLWDPLLDEITLTELKNLVLHGYVQEREINSVGKPKTQSYDGPSQIGSFNAPNRGTGFPMPTVLAQTWNLQLSKSFGLAVGAEAAGFGWEGWYAPAANLHRSAFGGRNYEYYSEDSYLSGMMAAYTVKGALATGTYVYMKHLIGYDQESYRDGLYCWMTEQALRENYLKPFQIAIEEGGLTGIMTAYGRIGGVWSGGSEGVLTGIVRNEWDFKGTILTDYADHQEFMIGEQMIRAGGDLWMDGYSNNGAFRTTTDAKMSSAFKQNLRTAAKHILYTYANAAYVNANYNADEDVIGITRAEPSNFPWRPILYTVSAVLVLGCAAWTVVSFMKKDPEAV